MKSACIGCVEGSGDEFGGDGSTVEVFDREKNKWTLLPSMKQHRASPFVAVCDGKLVVGGDSNNQGNLRADDVELFDETSGEWIASAADGASRDVLQEISAMTWVGSLFWS